MSMTFAAAGTATERRVASVGASSQTLLHRVIESFTSSRKALATSLAGGCTGRVTDEELREMGLSFEQINVLRADRGAPEIYQR